MQPNTGAGGGWGDAAAAQWPPTGIDANRLKAPPTTAWNDPDWNSRSKVSTLGSLACIVTDSVRTIPKSCPVLIPNIIGFYRYQYPMPIPISASSHVFC